MAITNLTGYTWVGNETIVLSSTFSFSINYIIGGHKEDEADVFESRDVGTQFALYYCWAYGKYIEAYGFRWYQEALRTIEITGGADTTNPNLIAWLEANGTLTKGGGGGRTPLMSSTTPKKSSTALK